MKIIRRKFGSGDEKFSKGKSVKDSDGIFSDMIQEPETETEDIDIDLENLESGEFERLSELLSQAGDTLSEEPTPDNFLKYKQTIKSFVTAIRDNMESKQTTSHRGFRKINVYQTFETIDESLAEIAQKIMNQEKDRLDYLKLVNGIRGLIVDLLM